MDSDCLVPASGESYCEWKGTAVYWDVVVEEQRAERAAWSYPDPYDEYASLRDELAFFAGRVSCRVGDERVTPQPGGFYGGWITSSVVGPFKGAPGSEDW